ncbi:glutaminyl-peptide cyclotransferase-like [Eurosta solidaginis]|uniref:glutaminyl-peptide cyclotransferase-like n=1 Tax=Eurosta solidaginis TaxID=178769 RepID=UPI0035315E61
MAGSSNFITFFVLSISVCVKQYLCVEYPVGPCQRMHPVIELSDEKLLEYGELQDVQHLRYAVNEILIPRVVDSDGHTRVGNYIINSLCQMGWYVDADKFYERVPILETVQLHNIIAKLNPVAERFLVLACHYDGKYFANFEFLGATTSAVPCAMLLNMAHVLREKLAQFRNTKLSLMFIFFDGEESTEGVGGPPYSRYGSRQLANRWRAEGILNSLDILVTLDNIGLGDTTFHSFFSNTEAWFSRLVALEERWEHSRSRVNPRRYFTTNPIYHILEGSYMPFQQQNVPILHLSPPHLPSVWHTIQDNGSIIRYASTDQISRIVRLFTMEYLLSGVGQ